MSVPRSVMAALTAAVALTASSCGEQSPAPGDDLPSRAARHSAPASPLRPVVGLNFDDARLEGDRLITRNDADTIVYVRVASAAGGRVTTVTGSEGLGVRFPQVSASANPPRAALVVTTRESVDGVNRLSPADRNFSFGARFRLDRVSERGRMDNGNNLVQRGLGNDLVQYKLQVDHGAVSCRVAGDLGAVEAKSTAPVKLEEWYSASCSRAGDTVRLVVRRLHRGATYRAVSSGDIGSVTASSTTPLAIGGKVTSAGDAIRGNSDQFNGTVDDVFLEVAADE